MATKHLNKIFLSASIPSIERDETFYKTADIIAIRDAVRALAAVIIPNAHLVWGGHPSITPLIRNVMVRMSSNLQQHVTIYQSLFFEKYFPADNFDFENIVTTEAVVNDQPSSLLKMRNAMIGDNQFKAAIFIGGMEGIFQEYEIFKSFHPKAMVLPVASTGAAAKILFDNNPENYNQRLSDDYAYMALFKDILTEYLS
jgi:hypothetical protein